LQTLRLDSGPTRNFLTSRLFDHVTSVVRVAAEFGDVTMETMRPGRRDWLDIAYGPRDR
jgi:hypothetical protein